MKTDITKLFEEVASHMGVSPARLADAVNAMSDMDEATLQKFCDETGIDAVDVSALRAKLVMIAGRATKH